MKTFKVKKSVIAASVAIASGLMSVHSQAQMLEEVVVTATKREAGMQDVPIAISVMDGNQMTEQGIKSLQDITLFVPNVSITPSFGGDRLIIRGVGSGQNYGFEQSVGTFIDGIYFGRGQASRTTFLDLERVEVLKGSQSTLFGKNTIAGAINITTRKPTEEFEGTVEGTYEEEFNAWSTTLKVSGPITDNLGGRLVLKTADQDGWVDNTYTNDTGVHQEDYIGRGILDWMLTDTLSTSLKYETGKTDTKGTNEVISKATDNTLELWGTQDPNIASVIGTDGYKHSQQTFAERKPFWDREWDILTLTVEEEIGEYSLKSITGYVDYSFSNDRDVDYSPLQAINRGRDEDHKQFSQEFLLISPESDTFEYMLGLYYQDEKLKHKRHSDISAKALFESGAQVPPVFGIPEGVLDTTNYNDLEQDTETWSTFGQGTFHISESIRMIAGLRYSRDEKDLKKKSYFRPIFAAPNSPAPDNQGLFIFAYNDFLRFANEYTFKDGEATIFQGSPSGDVTPVVSPIDTRRTEDHVTGDLTFQWDFNIDTMLYAKYGTGYKAGGFDEDNALGVIASEEYEDETSRGFEIGAKMELFEGRGRLNLAAFNTKYKDSQLSTFDGTAGTVVGNAGEISAKGIELDAMYAVTDELNVYGAFAYLDTVYDEYDDAACNYPQTVAWTEAGNMGTCTQDLGGERPPFAPEYTGNIGASYATEITQSLELSLSIDVAYSDSFFIVGDLDPNAKQDSFTKVQARIAIGNVLGDWTIALLGKNLTDETTRVADGDIPLGSIGFGGSYVAAVEAPRSFEIQARYNF